MIAMDVTDRWRLLERIAESVSDGSGGCLEWTRQIDRGGYGRIQISYGDGYSGSWLAHRAVWEAVVGTIPPDTCVCHHCDNRRCVAPDHLFLGSPADNIRDMRAKGRAVSPPAGASHHKARLGPGSVREIRRRRALGETCSSLSAEFGVVHSVISSIARRETWRDVE